jgi:N utilization substance protein B
MALVDRNILRIAAYEMRYIEDVPPTVVINEALEIAKRYAEPDAVGFINGILDSLQVKEAGISTPAD